MEQIIQNLPTFVRTAFDEYVGQREIKDYYSKYRSLECVYATIIKFTGLTFAILVADHDEDAKQDVWRRILESSSLGGWVDATNAACRALNRAGVDDAVRAYCREYSDYGKHQQKDLLDDLAKHLNLVVNEINRMGYKMAVPKSLNLIRALDLAVSIRNKIAHGALGPVFFSRVEVPLVDALKRLMALVPFSKFVCWGRYAGRAVEFVENPPASKNHPVDPPLFWIESELLSQPCSDIPFLTYREESRKFFFLNSAIGFDDPKGEYIDYASGSVVYREVRRDWEQVSRDARAVRPRNYRACKEVLAHDLSWREIPLTNTGHQSCSDEVGVYMFVTTANVGGWNVEVVLYVGRTTNLRERLASYLRILKKYDDSRQEIRYMFDTYGGELKLYFSTVDRSRIASVERAIYEVAMPEFNILAPSQT